MRQAVSHLRHIVAIKLIGWAFDIMPAGGIKFDLAERLRDWSANSLWRLGVRR